MARFGGRAVGGMTPTARSTAVAETALTYAVMHGCGVITGVIASRSLGAAGRGELAAMIVWGGVLVSTAALGLPEAVSYFAAKEPADGPRSSGPQIWATGQVTALALGVLATLAGWWMIPAFVGPAAAAPASAIRWFVLWFAVPSMGSICAAFWLRGAGRLRAFNVSRATVNLVHAAGAVVLLVMGSHSVRAFAAALLVSVFASWVMGMSLGPLGPALKAGASWSLLRRMLQYGSRVQLGNWANMANVRLDQLLLSVLAPAAALGIYVVGVSYASLLLALPFSAVSVMQADVVREHHAGRARLCLETWYRRVLWSTVLAGALIGPLAVVVIPAAFGEEFRGATPIALLLVPATMLLGMNGIVATAFQGIGRPAIGSQAEIVGLLVTVVALGAFLPRYGVYGAVLASLLAYGANHLYLLRKAVIILGVETKALYVPTREDVAAARRAVLALTHRLTTGPSTRAQGL